MSRSDEDYSSKDCWPVIESYFNNKQHLRQLVKHQIESYNDFIQNQMKRTIDMFKLDIKKEVMPYSLYNKDTINQQYIKYEDAKKELNVYDYYLLGAGKLLLIGWYKLYFYNYIIHAEVNLL